MYAPLCVCVRAHNGKSTWFRRVSHWIQLKPFSCWSHVYKCIIHRMFKRPYSSPIILDECRLHVFWTIYSNSIRFVMYSLCFESHIVFYDWIGIGRNQVERHFLLVQVYARWYRDAFGSAQLASKYRPKSRINFEYSARNPFSYRCIPLGLTTTNVLPLLFDVVVKIKYSIDI